MAKSIKKTRAGSAKKQPKPIKEPLKNGPGLKNDDGLKKDIELFEKLKSCIDEKIRPFIQMDGGDIEVLELVDGPLDEKGKPSHKVLRVQLHGACVGCMASTYTLQFGVQNAINEEFPDEDIMLEQVGD